MVSLGVTVANLELPMTTTVTYPLGFNLSYTHGGLWVEVGV